MKKLNNKGFTIIELLITISIIAALAIVVFATLSPGKQLQKTRNTRRASDVGTILAAINQSINDNGGVLPTNLTANGLDKQLGTGNAATCSPVSIGGCTVAASTACADLMTGASNLSKYIKSMPIDPTGGTTYDATKTGYVFNVGTYGIVTVKACGAESGAIINLAR